MTEPTSPQNAARPAAVASLPAMLACEIKMRALNAASLPRDPQPRTLQLKLLDEAVDALAALAQPSVEATAEITRLRELAATCYAGLGAECDLPEPWLDALSQAANGEAFSLDGLLPFSASPEASAAVLRDWEIACDDCAGTGKVDKSEPLHVDGRYMGQDLFRIPCDTCLSTGILVSMADIPKEIQR